MLTHARATGAARHAPEPPLQPCPPDGGLMQEIGDVDGEHIVLLGKDGPDLMCALVRAGALEVAHLAAPERLQADSASMVIVPVLPSADWLASALPSLRRAMLPNARIILRAQATADALGAKRIRKLLALHGYDRIRAIRRGEWLVTSAELPAFGLRKAA